MSARGARLVIVNSELTRADVVREYGVAAERVAVVPDPVIPAAHGSSAERGSVRRLAGADDFVLYVGKLSRRRRIPELLAAYEIVRRGRPGLRLVLAGPEGDAPVERIAGALGLEPHVRVAYLPAAELRDLYASARVLVMLADHEGFGRPVTEAMAAGCPVVVAAGSTIGALERAVTREGLVLESAADDPVALAATLELVLADADLRAGLVRTGRAYVEALDTPAAAAQRIMAHLAEAAGSPA